MTSQEPGSSLPPLPYDLPSPLIQDFVEHWGLMARSWGINPTMGELFALLFISAREWTADELRDALKISRGNASMNLRELMTWGVVHRVRRPGERREHYRAEGDVWALFRRIVTERRRRELDPTIDLLEHASSRLEAEPGLTTDQAERIRSLLEFFRLVGGLADLASKVEPAQWRELLGWIPGGLGGEAP